MSAGTVENASVPAWTRAVAVPICRAIDDLQETPEMREGYIAALNIVDQIIQMFALHDKRPNLLHHYTSLDTAVKILKERDLWLCHCEYLNDTSEIHNASALIKNRLALFLKNTAHSRTENQFFSEVDLGFDSQIKLYEAFVFSMSEGEITNINAQDVLSSWRAYGKDGRGVCLSFESKDFITVSKGTRSGFRLSRVIYNEQQQIKLVDSILNQGYITYSRINDWKEAIKSAVAALIFMMPILKNPAFGEEKEWRFIYLPEDEDPTVSTRKFYVRGDLIIPYYSLWNPSEDKVCPTPPVAEIMIGPSSHQELNLRSLEFLRGRAATKASLIPYRGIN